MERFGLLGSSMLEIVIRVELLQQSLDCVFDYERSSNFTGTISMARAGGSLKAGISRCLYLRRSRALHGCIRWRILAPQMAASLG